MQTVESRGSGYRTLLLLMLACCLAAWLNDGRVQAQEPPSLSINDVSVQEGNDGTRVAEFVVRLSRTVNFPVSVQFATASGSAVMGEDFLETRGEFVFQAGQLEKVIRVPVIGDRRDEPNEEFPVLLFNPTGARMARGQGIGTILDDDEGEPEVRPSLSINDVEIREGNDGTRVAEFVVRLSRVVSFPVSIQFTTANGSAVAGEDFAGTRGEFVFQPGQIEKVIRVPIIGDLRAEPNEEFPVQIFNPTGANVARGQGIGHIINDDEGEPPSLSINDVEIREGNDGTRVAEFVVRLSRAVTFPVSVVFETANGSAVAGEDFVNTRGEFLFQPGQIEKVIRVPIIGDVRDEPNERFPVLLFNPTGARMARGQGLGIIIDDDDEAVVPSLRINDVEIREGNSGTRIVEFTVRLSQTTSQEVSVYFTTANGSAVAGEDFVATADRFVFLPGQLEKVIRVPIIGDLRAEPNEQFPVLLFNPSGAGVADNQGIGTIINDDGTTQ